MDYYINAAHIDLDRTLCGGQCFRWTRDGDIWRGTVGARAVKIRKENKGAVLLDIPEKDVPFWKSYFDEETDYEAIIRQFSADETLKKAAENSRGLRILRQEPFETLISFIISQNNNIPRIRGIINRLCETLGEPIEGVPGEFAFPAGERLAAAEESELAPLRAGFRVRYILDAARKTQSGEVDLEKIYEQDYETGKTELKKIIGVGDKVADCVLLFAYHKTEAFPTDVWIKRITAKYYKDGLPECMGNYKGIAQQYLFEYFRTEKEK